jgi:hypothetical protein
VPLGQAEASCSQSPPSPFLPCPSASLAPLLLSAPFKQLPFKNPPHLASREPDLASQGSSPFAASSSAWLMTCLTLSGAPCLQPCPWAQGNGQGKCALGDLLCYWE